MSGENWLATRHRQPTITRSQNWEPSAIPHHTQISRLGIHPVPSHTTPRSQGWTIHPVSSHTIPTSQGWASSAIPHHTHISRLGIQCHPHHTQISRMGIHAIPHHTQISRLEPSAIIPRSHHTQISRLDIQCHPTPYPNLKTGDPVISWY